MPGPGIVGVEEFGQRNRRCGPKVRVNVVRPPGQTTVTKIRRPLSMKGSAPTSVGAGEALLTVSSTTPLVLRLQRLEPCAGTAVEPVGRAT